MVKVVDEESKVRQAALAAFASWQRPRHPSRDSTPSPHVHPKCAFFVKKNDRNNNNDDDDDDGDDANDFVAFWQGDQTYDLGRFLRGGGTTTRTGRRDDEAVPDPATTTTTAAAAAAVAVDHVKILPVGRRSAASVQVRVVSSSSDGFVQLAGFVVMLRQGRQGDDDDGHEEENCWKAISVALAPSSSSSSSSSSSRIVPDDLAAVTSLVWDGYGRANRRCDAAEMAKYFHESCRLTYVGGGDDGDEIQIVDHDAFLTKVGGRYEDEAAHRPFAHLRDRHDVVGAGDALVAAEFAAPSCPDLCLVTLRIGHPPFLWTDLLTCARVRARPHDDDDDDHAATSAAATDGQNHENGRHDGRWWIVHKSSESEPFLVDQARPR